MPDLLSIGASALSAAQVGIAVTGNNISNASTPGYSRQTVLQTASPSQNYAFGYVGEGTTVSSVQRVYDQTLGKQLNDATSASNASSAYYTQISNVNNLISNSTSGLSTAMTNFFSAMTAAAASPTDSATRQTVLSSAQSLANSFNSINQSLGQINSGINSQISSSVSAINSYSSQLASLNAQIVSAQSSSTNPPNDLLDQRDQLVNQLSQYVQTSVVKQNDGSYSVFIGNGIPLVVGQQTYSLATTASSTDPQSLDITYGSTTNPTVLNANNISGGSLGGLLQFRSETLQPVENQVGQLAVTFASSYNSQLANGYDLSGNAGTNLFNVPTPVTVSSSNNTDPTKSASATIVDASKITSSDYTLKYSNGQYSITRSGDNQVVWQGATLPATVDGLQINVNTSSPTNGDTYLIEPTRNAAGLISVSMTDPSKLALSGSATAGSNDNTNALALQALQNAATVATTGSSSSQSFTQAFSQLSSNVGSKTNELNITNQANTSALNSATTAVQSNSGVNLDEEATNLLRYQQAYQAAGKMMQIASTLFNTLLQISP